jgi:transcriptional regulator with XRE-family HTH domain
MNMSLNKTKKLRRALRIRTQKEKNEFEVEKLQINILNEINRVLREKGWNKSILAKKLGYSKSYVSQIFSVDKLMNLEFLTKLQRVLGFRWEFAAGAYEPEFGFTLAHHGLSRLSDVEWVVSIDRSERSIRKAPQVTYPQYSGHYDTINVSYKHIIN